MSPDPETPESPLLIAVHGFTSGPEVWDPLLSALNGLDSTWQSFPFPYKTGWLPRFLTSRYPTLDEIAADLKKRFLGEFQDAHSVVIVAHSFGGIVVQRLLADLLETEPTSLGRIHSVVLLATPNLGSEFLLRSRKALLNFLLEYVQEGVLRPGRRALRAAHASVANGLTGDRAKAHGGRPIRFHAIAGTTDRIVKPRSAHGLFPEQCRSFIEGDHFSIVKPSSEDRRLVELLSSELRKAHADDIARNHNLRARNDSHVLQRESGLGEPAALDGYISEATRVMERSNCRALFIAGRVGMGRAAVAREALNRYLARHSLSPHRVIHWRLRGAYSTDSLLDESLRVLDWADRPPRSAVHKAQAVAQKASNLRACVLIEGAESLVASSGHGEPDIADEGLRRLLEHFGERKDSLTRIVITGPPNLPLVRSIEHVHEVRIDSVGIDDMATLLRSLGLHGPDQDVRLLSSEAGALPSIGICIAKIGLRFHAGSATEVLASLQTVAADALSLASASTNSSTSAAKALLLFRTLAGSDSHEWNLLRLAAEFPGGLQRKDLLEVYGESSSTTPPQPASTASQALSVLESLSLVSTTGRWIAVPDWARDLVQSTTLNSPQDPSTFYSRLIESCRERAKSSSPRREELEWAYSAATLSCRAQDYSIAAEVFWDHIARGREFFSQKVMGFIDRDLALTRLFFDSVAPPRLHSEDMDSDTQLWLKGTLAYLLTAKGQTRDAMPIRESVLDERRRRRDWGLAAMEARNLAVLLVHAGELRRAEKAAYSSLEHVASARHQLATSRYDDPSKLDHTSLLCTASLALVKLSLNESREAYRLLSSLEQSTDSLHPLTGLEGFLLMRSRILLQDTPKSIRTALSALEGVVSQRPSRNLENEGFTHLAIGLGQMRLGKVEDALCSADTGTQLISLGGRMDRLPMGLIASAELRLDAINRKGLKLPHQDKALLRQAEQTLDRCTRIANYTSSPLYWIECERLKARCEAGHGKADEAQDRLRAAMDESSRREYELGLVLAQRTARAIKRSAPGLLRLRR